MHHHRTGVLLALTLIATTAAASGPAVAQTGGPNAAPNPYQMDSWATQLPQGRTLGQPIGVEIDHSDGKSLWVFERCGGKTCTGSQLAPIWKFDASGAAKANFGAGMFNFPHGLFVDHDGNVPDPRDVPQLARLVREKAGGQKGQGRVLVAVNRHTPGQPTSAANHQIGHGRPL